MFRKTRKFNELIFGFQIDQTDRALLFYIYSFVPFDSQEVETGVFEVVELDALTDCDPGNEEEEEERDRERDGILSEKCQDQ